jgi:Fic family protein
MGSLPRPAPPPKLDEPQEGLFLKDHAERLFAPAPTNEKYLHWDELRYRDPPAGLDSTSWWHITRFRRRIRAQEIPLRDVGGRRFSFVLTDEVQRRLHDLSLRIGGRIEFADLVSHKDARDRYYVASLVEEAITSSQLEGASTTRRVAERMLQERRAPRDEHERMILNNYKAMLRVGEILAQPTSEALIFELHRILTDGTLKDDAAGRLRRPDEPVEVSDDEGEVYHTPPPASELPNRMRAMCAFANSTEPFLHPVLRAILLHFWLAYDHPFVDGNGRTARALFYWAARRADYWLFEFISISQILLRAPKQYGRAFLLTETDDNDLTYFVLHQLHVIEQAVASLVRFVERRARELRATEGVIEGDDLNLRQREVLRELLRHPERSLSIEGHRSQFNVVYATARADLERLAESAYLERVKMGRRFLYRAGQRLKR